MNREHVQAYRLRKIINELLDKLRQQQESADMMERKQEDMYKYLVQVQRYIQLEQESNSQIMEYAPEPPAHQGLKDQERVANQNMALQGRAVYRNWIASLLDSLYEVLGKTPVVDPLDGKKREPLPLLDVGPGAAAAPNGGGGPVHDNVQRQVEQRLEKTISKHEQMAQRQQQAESAADRLAWRVMGYQKKMAKETTLRDLEKQLDEVMNRKQQTDGNMQVQLFGPDARSGSRMCTGV